MTLLWVLGSHLAGIVVGMAVCGALRRRRRRRRRHELPPVIPYELPRAPADQVHVEISRRGRLILAGVLVGSALLEAWLAPRNRPPRRRGGPGGAKRP